MFSKPGVYSPVGMFSLGHIITALLCFVLIALCIFFTKGMKQSTYFMLVKLFAVLVTFLELFKIIWSIVNGQTQINNFVPLYFCSLFIYALWFSCVPNKVVKNLGLSFMAYGGIVAGIAFIVFPTTSFNTYPLFHFQCIYSMLYHSLMIYMGFMCLITKSLELNWKTVLYYISFCICFMIIAYTINSAFGSNLMFVSEPGNIPIRALHDIYACSPIVYTIVLCLSHLALGPVVYGISKINCSVRAKNQVQN